MLQENKNMPELTGQEYYQELSRTLRDAQRRARHKASRLSMSHPKQAHNHTIGVPTPSPLPWGDSVDYTPGYGAHYFAQEEAANKMLRSSARKIKSTSELNKTVELSPIDELNPDKDNWKFRTENGAIYYYDTQLPGCCGIVVISGVKFGNIKEGMKEVFYKEVEKHLRFYSKSKEGGTDYNMDRGAIMMSDAVNGEYGQGEQGRPYIYGMCKYLGWETSSEYYNPRSGNKVVTFMKHRIANGRANGVPVALSNYKDEFNEIGEKL